MENEMKVIETMEEVVKPSEEVVVEVCQKSGFGKGALIATGLAAAGFAMYKFGKNVLNRHRAKKDIDITNLNAEDDVEIVDTDNVIDLETEVQKKK